MFLFLKLRCLHFEFSAAFWVCFFFFFFCSDKPSVKWCHGDSSSCSILMWQIKSCCWQVYRQLYLGKCTHGLSTSKYFPLEKNITVIYGWSSVSEITPVAILLLLVASCLILGIVFLCSTTHEPPLNNNNKKNLTQLSSLPLTLFIQLSKDRNDLSCQGVSATSVRMTLPPVSAGLLIRWYWCTTATASSS